MNSVSARLHHARVLVLTLSILFLPGHGQVNCVVAGDLQEHTGVRTSLVRLTRRVQKAGTEAQTGGVAGPVADGVAVAAESAGSAPSTVSSACATCWPKNPP